MATGTFLGRMITTRPLKAINVGPTLLMELLAAPTNIAGGAGLIMDRISLTKRANNNNFSFGVVARAPVFGDWDTLTTIGLHSKIQTLGSSGLTRFGEMVVSYFCRIFEHDEPEQYCKV